MARGSHFCCPARGGQPWWWWCRSRCPWSGGGVVVTLGGRGPKASAVMRAAAEASAGLSFHGGTGALWASCIWGRVGGAARIDQLVSGAKVGRAHDSPRWWPRNVRLNRDPPAVVFIIREARATLAHLQYLLVAAFFLCRQPTCSLLSPTHHRINFALSNCDHLLYLSPLDWPNPSSSNAESISRHVASPNWESPPTTVPARTCDQPTRPSSPSSFVWPCDRNLSACLPPTERPRWPPVPPRSAYVFHPSPPPS